jgi:hypothetical protein
LFSLLTSQSSMGTPFSKWSSALVINCCGIVLGCAMVVWILLCQMPSSFFALLR